MSKKEYLIAEIREQRKVLGQLISRMRQKEDFDQDDCYAFELVTKQVEKTLRRINNTLSEDFLKDLSDFKYCN